MTASIFSRSASASSTIQSLYNEGRLYEGITQAKSFIADNGPAQSQYEIFLLAKGLFAADLYFEAKFWIAKTTANPLERIPLEEKINRKLVQITGLSLEEIE